MTARVGVVAQILGMTGIVTTARELPLVRMLLAELNPMCATGVVWLTDIATLPTDLVATDTEFNVRLATDGTVLEPGVLYLVPAHCCAWFEGPSIRIGSRSEVQAGAVDYFLSSMSIAWGPRSVALVPRIGSAADGEEGLARVSRAQGIAVGPAAFALLRETGTVRESTLKEVTHGEPIRQFQARFNGAGATVHPLSIARLFLLHPLSLDARAVASAAIWNAKDGGRIKMWLPGCRTGELIYAMAMLLAEATLRRGRASLRLQIFGTDADETALAFARAARYPSGQRSAWTQIFAVATRSMPARPSEYLSNCGRSVSSHGMICIAMRHCRAWTSSSAIAFSKGSTRGIERRQSTPCIFP